MIDASLVANLAAWSLQVLVVASIGLALPAALRLDAPGVRYGYWRALLAICFVLPFVQPRHPVAATMTKVLTGATVTDAVTSAQLAGPAGINWIVIALVVLLVGAAVRIAWIVFGLVHLQRLRCSGEAATIDEYEELQRLIGARAELRYVPGIKQPVTFGIRPAVVLLPGVVREQPRDVQRAILAHELFHVQRHDWAWLLVEELVRAVFWFHPAVWWLVSRIQLTREEVVDEMALLVAHRRSTYVQALLAFADTPPFTPVAAFARRRHLVRRIALISKEAVMSSKRLIVSCAAMAMAVAAGGWYAVGAFPLRQSPPHVAPHQGVGPLEAQAKPATPENPIPRRLNYVAPAYPAEAAALQLSGTVTIQATLDASGSISEARATGLSLRSNASGPFHLTFTNVGASDIEQFVAKAPAGPNQDPAALTAAIKALMQSARDAVLAWRYESPFEAPLSFSVAISFAADGKVVRGGVLSHETMPPPPPPPPPAGGVPGGAVSHMPPPPPPPPPPAGTVSHMAPPPPPPPPPAFTEGALKVGGTIAPPKKLRDVKPIYPEDAKAAGIQGAVIVEIRIDEDGLVSDARVLRSIPELDAAALAAVQQWAFVPTLMNGKPIPVVMTVTLNFTLQ